jgi:hypothetical protein
MARNRRLKPDRSIFGPIQPVIVLVIFGLTLVIWDIRVALIVLILIYLVYFIFTMYALLRTRNYYFILAGFFQLMMVVFLTFCKIGPIPLNEDIIRGLTIILFCSAVMAGYSLIAKKMKWRGREIFEIAAQDVEVDPETYTERPKPSGKIVYRREDLAFDQLTASLCDLHLDFFELYQGGKEVRIMDSLKSVNTNIFI